MPLCVALPKSETSNAPVTIRCQIVLLSTRCKLYSMHVRMRSAEEDAADIRKNGQGMKHMKQVASIPTRDFYRLVGKYGHDEVHSKSFIRYLQKKMPTLKTANI